MHLRRGRDCGWSPFPAVCSAGINPRSLPGLWTRCGLCQCCPQVFPVPLPPRRHGPVPASVFGGRRRPSPAPWPRNPVRQGLDRPSWAFWRPGKAFRFPFAHRAGQGPWHFLPHNPRPCPSFGVFQCPDGAPGCSSKTSLFK